MSFSDSQSDDGEEVWECLQRNVLNFQLLHRRILKKRMLLYIILLLRLQAIRYIPDAAIHCLLKFLWSIFSYDFKYCLHIP